MREVDAVVENDCTYPNCQMCSNLDCNKDDKDIRALLKRRRWAENPTLFRQKQRDYRERIKSRLPRCDECESCILVEKEKQDGHRRLCIDRMRLIERKVSNCPQWRRKRKR